VVTIDGLEVFEQHLTDGVALHNRCASGSIQTRLNSKRRRTRNQTKLSKSWSEEKRQKPYPFGGAEAGGTGFRFGQLLFAHELFIHFCAIACLVSTHTASHHKHTGKKRQRQGGEGP
jgi:hypothetical protein